MTLMHDLTDGYRSLPTPPPGAPRHATGADERHLAEHFEQLACGDRATVGERTQASLLALGGRIAERTEVTREHGDGIVAELSRIATALEALVDVAQESPTRPGMWRRAWRAVTGGPRNVEPVEPCVA